MKGWKELVLKLPGLPVGKTTITTEVTSDFFKSFEQSPIERASYNTTIVFDKKPGFYVLTVEANGWNAAICDRCLEAIQLPGDTTYKFYFKQGAGDDWMSEEDVVVLDEGVVELDIRPYVHEAIVLSLPIVNTYDCENDVNAPCDENILAFLRESEDESGKNNPSWDVLKNIKFED